MVPMILLLKKKKIRELVHLILLLFFKGGCFVVSGDIGVRIMRLMSYCHACKVEVLKGQPGRPAVA